MAITAFLSRSPGLLNRGPGGPAALGHVPHSSIFSTTAQSGVLRAPSAGCWLSLLQLISNWLTSCLHLGYIIARRPPSSCGHHKSHSIQPIHGQCYLLIFLDRMHLLFTSGQYVTYEGTGSIMAVIIFMDLSIQVQILVEAVNISLYADALRKGVNQSLFPTLQLMVNIRVDWDL